MGSGFLCGAYGYRMDAQFPYADLAGTGVGLVRGSIIALGLAFLKPVTSSELANMRFPSLQQLEVRGRPPNPYRLSACFLTATAKAGRWEGHLHVQGLCAHALSGTWMASRPT